MCGCIKIDTCEIEGNPRGRLEACPERKVGHRKGDEGKGIEMKKRSHIGSSFENFLAEEGILEETEIAAIKRVIAWQIKQAMEKKRISKTEMARRMRTSRPSVDRLLDPAHKSLTLSTMVKAALAVGGKVRVSIDMKKEGKRAVA